MPIYRAREAFTSFAGGRRRQYAADSIVPDEVADKAGDLVYTNDAPPVKRTAKKSVARKAD